MSTVKDSFDLGDGHDHNYNTLLTVIITSSYVKSHPETTLLDKVINSLNLIPTNIKYLLSEMSSWFLLIAIGAVGTKTRLQNLKIIGFVPILSMIMITLFLMCFIISFQYFYF